MSQATLEAVKLLYPFLVLLFGAGVTWGVMKASNKEAKTTVEDLKSEVKTLRDIGTEFRVLKTEHIATQGMVKDHGERLASAELEIATLKAERSTPRARRKR